MEDWQLRLNRLSERGKHLLETGLWSDCEFIVGDGEFKKIFSAHKMILSMSSPVFEAMFYGSLAEKGPIEIPDVQPEAFSTLLQYIYTDKVNLTTIDQACEICYAAKKYMFPFLVNQCIRFIWKDVQYPMAFKAYEFAKLFGETDLMKRCVQIISENATLVFSHKNSEDIALSTLLEVLDCEKLNICSELELVFAVYRWGVFQCKREGIDQSKENLRKVIGAALTKIRFLTLLPSQFASCSAIQGLLTQDEAYSLLMKISSSSSLLPLPDGFSLSTTPRTVTESKYLTDNPILWCERTIVDQSTVLNYRNLECVLKFTVSEDVVLHGIVVATQLGHSEDALQPQSIPQYSYMEDLDMLLIDDNRREKIRNVSYQNRVGFKELMDIRFSEPAYLFGKINYTIVVELNKPGVYPIGNYSKHTNVCAGVCFTFCVGNPLESIRESIIRSIIFSPLATIEKKNLLL